MDFEITDNLENRGALCDELFFVFAWFFSSLKWNLLKFSRNDLFFIKLFLITSLLDICLNLPLHSFASFAPGTRKWAWYLLCNDFYVSLKGVWPYTEMKWSHSMYSCEKRSSNWKIKLHGKHFLCSVLNLGLIVSDWSWIRFIPFRLSCALIKFAKDLWVFAKILPTWRDSHLDLWWHQHLQVLLRFKL